VLLPAVRFFVASSILWAAVVSVIQVLLAWGGGRKDYSERSGSTVRGMAYNFTIAMLPGHKESVSRHPAKFVVGVVMHVGVVLAVLGVVLLLAWPAAGFWTLAVVRPLVALSLAAGLYLLGRRFWSRNLRAMSSPEDYVAALATCGLLALASVCPVNARNQLALLIYAGLLFVYLPLGKLRHAVFFFVARADYGRRLGYRRVYPPSEAGTE
jgi:hypothetical protein